MKKLFERKNVNLMVIAGLLAMSGLFFGINAQDTSCNDQWPCESNYNDCTKICDETLQTCTENCPQKKGGKQRRCLGQCDNALPACTQRCKEALSTCMDSLNSCIMATTEADIVEAVPPTVDKVEGTTADVVGDEWFDPNLVEGGETITEKPYDSDLTDPAIDSDWDFSDLDPAGTMLP